MMKTENNYTNRHGRKSMLDPARSFFYNAVNEGEVTIPMRVLEQESIGECSFPAAAELKYDGIRAIVRVSHGRPSIQSRRGHDLGSIYPSLMKHLSRLPDAIYDGEIYHPTIRGQPAAMRDSNQAEVQYAIFDVIHVMPYIQRRIEVVIAVRMARSPRIIYSKFVGIVKAQHEVSAMVKPIIEDGLEGIVLKPVMGKYVVGGEGWVKVKSIQ